MIGPFNRTDSGNVYILNVVDSFSKFVIAVAIPDKKTETVVKVLVDRVFHAYGLPSTICHDGGKEFCSTMFTKFNELYKISQIQITPYLSWPNGVAEKANDTITSILRKVAADDINNWDLYIKTCVYAYNTTVHTTTKQTPYFLHFGKDPRVPTSLQYEPVIECYDAENYPVNVANKFKLANELAKHHTARAIAKQQKSYNKSAKEYPYMVNDHVYIKIHVLLTDVSPKLQKVFRGPFRIVEAVNDVIFKVSNVTNGDEVYRVHANHMKPAYVRSGERESPPFQGADDLLAAEELRGKLTAGQKLVKEKVLQTLVDPAQSPTDIDVEDLLRLDERPGPAVGEAAVPRRAERFVDKRKREAAELTEAKRRRSAVHQHDTRYRTQSTTADRARQLKAARYDN